MRANEYRRGYHDAMRAAVTWLHARAESMNDRHAMRILFSAADHLGHEAAALRQREPIADAAPGNERDDGTGSSETP